MLLKKGLSFIITLALLAFADQASAGSNAKVSLDLIADGVVNKTASGEFAGMQLYLDTQIETPAAQSNTLTISEKKAGDTIQLQLFLPMAAGKQTYGYEIELDLPGKTFSNYIGSISGKDFTGASLLPAPGRPILSALLISTPVVPANGYLGQIDLQVINTLAAETTLIVKAASMAGLNRQQDPLDVSNAVITFTVISFPGDFDSDLDVDFADFLAFVGVFGLSSSDANYDVRMDMNSDGAINFADFLAFVGVFGRTYGQPIVYQTFDLPGGSLEDFRFTVDTNVQQNVILQGEFSVENGRIQMAVMGESEYQTWQEGGTPTVLYSPGETSGETFVLPIYDSDTYYIIFRNTSANAVRVNAEIFLLSTPPTAGSRIFIPENLTVLNVTSIRGETINTPAGGTGSPTSLNIIHVGGTIDSQSSLALTGLKVRVRVLGENGTPLGMSEYLCTPAEIAPGGSCTFSTSTLLEGADYRTSQSIEITPSCDQGTGTLRLIPVRWPDS